jgi:hypothetical protein
MPFHKKIYNRFFITALFVIIGLAAATATVTVTATAPFNFITAAYGSEIDDFKYIPDNYDLFIKIKPGELIKDLSISAPVKVFLAATPFKNITAVKSIFIFIAFGRHKKGNIDFISFIHTPPGFDYDKFIENITAFSSRADGDSGSDANKFKTGGYESKTVFRYYNLAGCYHGGKIILSSAAGLKKFINSLKVTEAANLSNRKDFSAECAAAMGRETKSPLIALIGPEFLASIINNYDESEFAYKPFLKDARCIIFIINGRKLKTTVKFSDSNLAAAFKESAERQFAQSLKESADTLAEVDVIEVETSGRKLTRFALKELVYARKLLKFIIELNKAANTNIISTAVEININTAGDIIKSIDELICAHIHSWGLITHLILSSEAGCERNIKLLETAALLYLAKYPDRKKSITVENIYESELLSDFLKCPAEGNYQISVNERNKIIVNCDIHNK